MNNKFYKELVEIVKDIKKSKYNRIALRVTIIVCIYIIVFEIVFKNTEEWFELGNEIVSVLSSIAFSIISSYIFYFIVVYLPERSKRKSIKVYLNSKITQLISIGNNMINHLLEGTSYKKEELSKDIIVSICKNTRGFNEINLAKEIVRDNEGKINILHWTWSEYLLSYPPRSMKIIEEILIYSTILDDELMVILNDLNLCTYLSDKNIINVAVKSHNLHVMGNFFYEYYKLILKLKL